ALDVVCPSTFRRWCLKGWTSFGLSLDIVSRNGRLLVPELKVLVVHEFLREVPLPKRGAPASVREEFRHAVTQEGFRRLRPRTPYSRARPPPQLRAELS